MLAINQREFLMNKIKPEKRFINSTNVVFEKV